MAGVVVSQVEVKMRVNDLEPALRTRLWELDQDGARVGPLDLTDAQSLRFLMRSAEGGGNVVDAAAVIEDRPGGVVKYVWQEGDTANPGPHLCEFEVLWPAGRPQTGPTNHYLVVTFQPDLG